MNTLEIFNFNNNALTILGTHEEPWFLALEIGEILQLKNIRQNVQLLREKDVRVYPLYRNGFNRKVTIISEHGLYQLIFRSNVEIAKKFRYYIFDEILPSLRRNRTYSITNENDQLRLKSSTLEKKLTELNDENVALASKVEEYEEKSRLFINQSNQHIRVSERLIQNGHLSQNYYDNVMKLRTLENQFKMIHPDFYTLKSRLGSISKFIAQSMMQINNTKRSLLPICKSSRTNYYPLSFWESYGDDLLDQYIFEFPVATWNIAWNL